MSGEGGAGPAPQGTDRAAPLIVIAAGGTGGHMFPAQALAEAMLARGWRVRLSTDARGARYTGGFPPAVEIAQVASATFARGGALAKLAVPLRIAAGVVSAVAAMRAERPAVVVGFGGYPSIPAMAAAMILRLPRVIHEQNGVLGRVNRVFAPRVDAVACGTWPTDLPAGVTGSHIGNPVRGAILARAGAPYVPPSDTMRHVLVMGGSQGARILSDVVPAALAELPETLRQTLSVAHQARAEDHDRVSAAYAAAGIAAEVRPFFDDAPERFAAAQLVITRSGASTMADLSVIGRPAILVPFAAATADHQTANARALVQGGGAVLLAELQFTPRAVAEAAQTILSDPHRAAAMAAAALAQGRPDATIRLVSLVESLLPPRLDQNV